MFRKPMKVLLWSKSDVFLPWETESRSVFPLFCVCMYVCAAYMHQAWRASWCALQVCLFAWRGPPSPYCTLHPSTKATWSPCRGSMGCAVKPRKSTWGEVRRGQSGRGGVRFCERSHFYCLLREHILNAVRKAIEQWLVVSRFSLPCRALQDVSVSAVFKSVVNKNKAKLLLVSSSGHNVLMCFLNASDLSSIRLLTVTISDGSLGKHSCSSQEAPNAGQMHL